MRIRFLILSLVSSVYCLPCHANIGDTIEQARQRLGEPSRGVQVAGSHHFHLLWTLEGLLTDMSFDDDGIAFAEQFVKARSNDRLSLNDARHILASESDMNNWIEYRLGERVAWRNTTKGWGALLTRNHQLIIVKEGDWVEAEIGGNWP